MADTSVVAAADVGAAVATDATVVSLIEQQPQATMVPVQPAEDNNNEIDLADSVAKLSMNGTFPPPVDGGDDADMETNSNKTEEEQQRRHDTQELNADDEEAVLQNSLNNNSIITNDTSSSSDKENTGGHKSIGIRIRRTSEKLHEDSANIRKKYSLDQLLSLKDSAIGREKPTTIPDVCRSILKLSPGTLSMNTRHLAGQDNLLLPSFMKGMGFGGGGGSSATGSIEHRGPPSGSSGTMNRNMYRGRLSAKEMRATGDDVDGKIIKMTVNITEEVKLKGSANAWKPRFMQKQDDLDEGQKQTQELSRQFRSVLNKLTPENFLVLVKQVKEFEINTEERLDNCIKILFEKAIMEPNFTDTYAQMCKELGTIISIENSAEGLNNFKRKLINQCQKEFEKHHMEFRQTNMLQDENDKKEVLESQTAEEAEEAKLELEEQKYRIRKRALGTIRFIGELYKHEQLTPKIMISCMFILMQEDMLDEESLECLCKLLTTIGARIEKGSEGALEDTFVKLQAIVDRKTPLVVCNRIRFMLLDLIDLRKDKWQPRRALATPKTREQIQKEVEAEENKNWVLNYNLPRGGGGGGGNRQDYHGDRGGGGGGGGSAAKNKRFVDEDGFVQPVSNRNVRPMPAIDPKKINLSQKSPEVTRLGSASMFQGWGKNNAFATLTNDEQQQQQQQQNSGQTPSFFSNSSSGLGGSGSKVGSYGGGGLGGPGSKKPGGGGGAGGGGSKKQLYHGRNSSRF